MESTHRIHDDFMYYLKYKDQSLIDLYIDLRAFVKSLNPDSNEFLYHTHALTSVYSVSDKLGDAFCMIPIYTNHLNLGFNRGTLLNDTHQLLQGTGKYIRHIPIEKPSDYRNDRVKKLILAAITFAKNDTNSIPIQSGKIISKIKR
ncbi:MAG: DUF1801 domain-containing protein [Flavobacteriaceae bacterium]|nr:DUF1801 domain-containing protein [Flavobacteriaceae bacterium]